MTEPYDDSDTADVVRQQQLSRRHAATEQLVGSHTALDWSQLPSQIPAKLAETKNGDIHDGNPTEQDDLGRSLANRAAACRHGRR